MGDKKRDPSAEIPAANQSLARDEGPHLDRGPREAGLAGPVVVRPDWVPWLVAFVVFAAYGVISVSYIVRLDPGSSDLGIFTEYVRQYAHLHAPIVDIWAPGGDLLGDHFHPIVALIAPFFLIASTPVTLVLAQALLVAISVIPVSRAAAAKLGRTPARIIAAAYGFSWGLQQMIDFDFHELAFAIPLLACSLSALVRGKTRAAVLWALPLVFVKEDQGFTVAAIGLVMLVTAWRARSRQATRTDAPADAATADAATADAAPRGTAPRGTAGIRAGLFLVLWGLAWSAVSIEVIIPFFNPFHTYDYFSEGGILGNSSSNSVINLLSQIGQDYPRKLGTVALTLLPVVFLALRSPLSLVAAPSIILRFINTNPSYWGPYYHYSAPLMPIAFVAGIDALARIQAARGEGAEPSFPSTAVTATLRYSPALMLAIALGLCFWAPVRHLWQPQTYTISPHARVEDAAMAKVPDAATVEATQDMEATLSARADVFYAGGAGNPAPQYIALDVRDYLQPRLSGSAAQWVKRDHRGASYRQIFSQDGVYVFRRM